MCPWSQRHKKVVVQLNECICWQEDFSKTGKLLLWMENQLWCGGISCKIHTRKTLSAANLNLPTTWLGCVKNRAFQKQLVWNILVASITIHWIPKMYAQWQWLGEWKFPNIWTDRWHFNVILQLSLQWCQPCNNGPISRLCPAIKAHYKAVTEYNKRYL